jgi:hypothetical protein
MKLQICVSDAAFRCAVDYCLEKVVRLFLPINGLRNLEIVPGQSAIVSQYIRTLLVPVRVHYTYLYDVF